MSTIDVADTTSGCCHASGDFVELDGETFYRITDFDELEPFLISVPSASDLWMFISTNGGLTAGRVSPEHCLFPYETVDRLHRGHTYSGPKTFVRWRDDAGGQRLWQPFAERLGTSPSVRRSLFKNLVGNRLRFEEALLRDELVFRYDWQACDEFGWVRTASITNTGPYGIRVSVLDGLQNLMPYGVELSMQQRASCLVDAYKQNECDAATGLATFSLTSRILDVSAAAEVQRATVAWCLGLMEYAVLLSLRQVAGFAAGHSVCSETRTTGRRGDFFVATDIRLQPGETKTWRLVADVGRDHRDIVKLRERLRDGPALMADVAASLARDTAGLIHLVASADGLQHSADRTASAHHFTNVLLNNMRGGVFADHYRVDVIDFCELVRTRSRCLWQRHAPQLAGMPRQVDHAELLGDLQATGDRDLLRLGREYLPLVFSRRHGDPSRPWNTFAIHARRSDGSRAYQYQGNWRDVFQNWEALAASYPGFLPGMIARFVNASTVDGFNPYHITRDGIEWEKPDPHDPWSNIGYWGDHQIVYLAKLLEAWQAYAPEQLHNALGEEIYCYADVPYRLKPFRDLVADSRQTIEFNADRDRQITERAARFGADAKLLHDAHGAVYYVPLLEKLLVPALSKLSNLVLDGGIWLNTQRPEWNDANNALVGPGLSVVTVCYLRRYLAWLQELLRTKQIADVRLSAEVGDWFDQLSATLDRHRHELASPRVSDAVRWRVLAALGESFCRYRQAVYARGYSGKRTVSTAAIAQWCGLAVEYLDHTIAANRRPDGLGEAYNLLQVDAAGGTAAVHRLPLMLEGQVALLSAAVLSPQQSVELVDQLYASPLYREDQRSFLLYPERMLPGFVDRNRVPGDLAGAIELVRRLLAADDATILVRDAAGQLRFHPDIESERDLAARLDELAAQPDWDRAVAKDRRAMHDLFDAVFHHRALTGRSGTMYGYEGLGCIYWHMVAKLLLAVQENYWRAVEEGDSPATTAALAERYYRVRSGLGFEKSPAEFGAFPIDPYSHTPRQAGAQQPGMTGQVKEEILTRWGELGVRVRDGRLSFHPTLLRRREFLSGPADFTYCDFHGRQQQIPLEPGSLAFTICQTPVVYRLISGRRQVDVACVDGTGKTFDGLRLDENTSGEIFHRAGSIARITVDIPAETIELE